MALYAAKSLALKTVGLALINNDAGPPYERTFRKVFEANGGSVVGVVWQTPGEVDFRAQANQLKDMPGIDAVFVASTAKEGAHLIRQSAEVGFKPTWLSITTIESPDALQIAGSAMDGLIYAAEAYDPAAPATQEFDKLYREKFGEASQNYAANAYDAVGMLYEIMRGGNVRGPEIRDRLYQLHYTGVTGPVSFDRNGDAKKKIMIKKVAAGQYQIVVPLMELTAADEGHE